ncbi:MAG: Sapep family Mn(2+)-dependent dipeptidase [Christensenellales bacterium]
MSEFFDKMIDSLMDLLAIDSTQGKPHPLSPFGKGVGECLQYIDELSKKIGFCTHNEEGYYLTADVGEGDSFGILGHVDVVPWDNDWDYSPLGERVGDVIYGRGVLDDKGPMLCCLWATYELLQQGLKPRKKIRFVWGGNEESGWKCIERYMQKDVMPSQGFSPDGDFPVINCEKGLAHWQVKIPAPDGLMSIKGGSRGNIVMADCECVLQGKVDVKPNEKVKVTTVNGNTVLYAVGKPAHASTPWQGDNALWHILGALNSVSPQWAKLDSLLSHNDGSGVGAKLSDDKSGKLTFNVGCIGSENIDGKTWITLTIDTRIPVTYPIQYVGELISKALGAKAELTHFHNPLYVEKDSELVQSLLSVYNEQTGRNAEPIAIGGGTYARALPCGVAFGPIFPDQISTIHQKNECVDIPTLRKTYDIYKQAIRKLCF